MAIFRRRIALALCLVSMAAHGATNRPSWVTGEIYNYNHQFAATDSAELSAKMSTMAQSPFQFYRGTDHIFFRDMATLPASAYVTAQTGYAWLGGDTHIGNFSADRDSNSDNRFALQDFDEGYLGQYVWDVRRLAVSMVLAGREQGIADADITIAINTMVDTYVGKMADFKGSSAELTYKLKSGDTSGVVHDLITKSSNDTRGDLLSKYTIVTNGARKFVATSSDLVAVSAGTYTAISSAMSAYIASIPSSKRFGGSYYAVKDIRQKLNSGVGSLGKLRYYVLIEGPSSDNSDDRILEVKQTVASAVATANPGAMPSYTYNYHEGCRAARTLRAQLLDADVLSGCTTISGAQYFVREKSPYKEDMDTALITSGGKLNTAAGYLAKSLAAAHALADQDFDSAVVPYSIDKQVSDAVVSKSGLKSEIVSFAFSYAQQVQLDWQAFVSAYKSGATLY